MPALALRLPRPFFFFFFGLLELYDKLMQEPSPQRKWPAMRNLFPPREVANKDSLPPTPSTAGVRNDPLFSCCFLVRGGM